MPPHGAQGDEDVVKSVTSSGTLYRPQATFDVVGKDGRGDLKSKSEAGMLPQLSLHVTKRGQVTVCLVD